MTRFELIQAVASKQSQLSDKQMERAVNCVFEAMVSVLEQAGRIEIRGFGSFSVRLLPERMARNPKTGESVRKKSRYSLHFTVGKELRTQVDRGMPG